MKGIKAGVLSNLRDRSFTTDMGAMVEDTMQLKGLAKRSEAEKAVNETSEYTPGGVGSENKSKLGGFNKLE